MDESMLVRPADDAPQLKKFTAEQMLTCTACLRANAPTRSQCLYCGAQLGETSAPEITTENASQDGPSDRRTIIVCRASASLPESVLDQLATRFQLKTQELSAALATGAPVPLSARTVADDANQIVSELNNLGIESHAVAEAELTIDSAHVMIRAVEFARNGLYGVAKHRKERLFTNWNDLLLIISGRLISHRVETENRRAGSSIKQLDRLEFTDDQTVIDLYSRSFIAPWRIVLNDFDFSCLGARKGLTAFENLKALKEALTERSEVVWDDSYARLRPVLANVWPLQSTASEARSRRPRAGRKDVSTVTASDNESQFNCYSRLVWFLKLRELESRSASHE